VESGYAVFFGPFTRKDGPGKRSRKGPLCLNGVKGRGKPNSGLGKKRNETVLPLNTQPRKRAECLRGWRSLGKEELHDCAYGGQKRAFVCIFQENGTWGGTASQSPLTSKKRNRSMQPAGSAVDQHVENTPSFAVAKKKNSYRCYFHSPTPRRKKKNGRVKISRLLRGEGGRVTVQPIRSEKRRSGR